uniref:ATP synthase F0 subunit 6 n=1 Tax=Artyfechinostomum sufrartyfex TaxID=408854 RepID=A0A1P8P0K3_9TREM|nr:ATP synthase F0 subunit 6 [Artyfechinostomum sufrartyfex]YP_010461007.1 ATP synthase F0 subunit 6 [Artyfechinostomum malayanum]APX55330.1 ATP synthase F0 subunit 6 [Artyfechinostomum sufrartyfex]ARH10829.1 ATP synthase F0 subunit 6 [Artyfechinostomum sufrartyfex]UUF68160.1 ATP synthase F0 subunit 6 [Artyfechinostomum malayanum]
MLVSRLSAVFSYISLLITGGLGDEFYRICLFGLLSSFLLLRVPYIYGMSGFGLFIIISIFPLFLSLFISRIVDNGPASFFSGFVPPGTPLWIAPFVCLAETLSYIVRPIVLMIRPFVNLTIGALGGVAIASLGFKFGVWIIGFLFLLFFYEVFVALVHWFIVCNILSFSEDH